MSKDYHEDIDGLRGISVLAVILFHFGLISKGYLGVDVFFCISGYLITSIIIRERTKESFRLKNFYMRRVRRILPLTFFISAISLTLGVFFMLPDDLENLSQSVIATNFSLNNVLQLITTRDYWDVVNDFKPLLHTWSLGIEEQFYLFYPFIFLLSKNKKLILLILTFLSIFSLILFLTTNDQPSKFYLIQFRFFELAAGGIAAILFKKQINGTWISPLLILLLCVLIITEISFIGDELRLIIVVLLSCGILITKNRSNPLSNFLLCNKPIKYMGLISFSVYMWHQPLLAFTKYFIIQSMSLSHMMVLFMIIVVLSIISYYFIEQPFRNPKKLCTKTVIVILSLVFLITNSCALYIYFNAGVLRNHPELDIIKSESTRGMHSKYNHNIYNYDDNFSSNGLVKVKIIGNSFARDWANILLESNISNKIEISYSTSLNSKSLSVKESDIIFINSDDFENSRKSLNSLMSKKYYVVGTKSFGINNGIFYNYQGEDYYKQRTLMKEGIHQKYLNEKLKYKDNYIDLVKRIIGKDQKVPVFTPNNKYISHDTRHLTKAGAKFFAEILETRLLEIIK